MAVSSSCKAVSEILDIFDSVGKITWLLGGNAKWKNFLLEIVAAHMELFIASNDIEEASIVSLSSINQASNSTSPNVLTKSASASVISLSALVAKYYCLVEAIHSSQSSHILFYVATSK